MANVTDADLFLAVEAFLETIPQLVTVIQDDDCDLTDDMLPAAIVMIADGQVNRSNPSWWTEDQAIEIGVLFTHQCGVSLEEQRAQMLAALALRNVIPDAYARLQWLTLNGQRIPTHDLGSMTKSRLELRPWGEEVYWGTTYRFTPTTERR